MGLEQFYLSLPEAKRHLLFGVKSEDPLRGAFTKKRTVHAGLKGSMVPPPLAQKEWKQCMAVPVETDPPIRMAYFHIPFCKTKCLYCGFFQNGTDQEVEDRYVDHLILELSRAAGAPRIQSAPIHAVFIGGGTPTSLSPENARRLLHAIRTYLPLANDYELTLEGRIHDLVPEKMDVWMEEGVNRMSLGVQSFNTKVRRQVGRIDTEEAVLERLAALKACNQCSVVIDLMFGLPDQTMEVWEHDVKQFVASGIDGADLYQLDVFEKSDLQKAIAGGRLSAAATTAEQTAMFSFGRDYLERCGYKRLSHCHWARNNRERSLYNTLARAGADLFAFGCGAGGHAGGLSTMLHRSLPVYEKMVEAGQKPFMFLSRQSPLASFEAVVQGDMNQCRFDLTALKGMDARLAGLQWLADLWEDCGLWHWNGIHYRLTEAGEFWVVNMTQTILECISYLLSGETSAKEERVAAQG